MPVYRLDSVHDSRLDAYRDLPSSAAGPRGEVFVVEGKLLAERLLASPIRPASLLTEERFVESFLSLAPASLPIYVLPRQLLRELTGFPFHRGVLACGHRPPSLTPRQLLDGAGADYLLSVCVGVQELDNLGGILRSSAAFGVRGVLLDARCADPFARRVARTSMGANFQIRIAESADLAADLSDLRREFGVRLVATVCDDAALPLERAPSGGGTALLFGSEGYGLDQTWIDRCDLAVTIPIQAAIDSLNVNVAAGICLQHFACVSRQRCGED